ncbi:aldehyde dehydrogenase family protein [Kribbella sp. VKM Ac-2568]|nr:aldehyde dehydrogenase family protein [Kribbella sp. VKM Ac-2568]
MTHDVINPATEKVVHTLELASVEDTGRAIARAAEAFRTWREVSPADRGRLQRRFADAVDADLDHLAVLEVENAGHTFGNARWEAGNVRDVLTYYSAAPSGSSASRYPLPAASISPCTNHSASSASSCPGTSRCGLDAFSETKNIFISTED